MSYLAVSPLTGTIFLGRLNAKRNAFVGEKRDMTSDFLRCVIEKAEFHGGSFEINCSDGGSFVVAVTKATGESK